MRQILSGVRYLHMRSIVHRDIKPENVLCVGKTWPLEVKLTDFGLSNFLNDDPSRGDDAMLLSHVGTSYYIAPEIVGKTGYGPAVDVWACGVVLYVSTRALYTFFPRYTTDTVPVHSDKRANLTNVNSRDDFSPR